MTAFFLPQLARPTCADCFLTSPDLHRWYLMRWEDVGTLIKHSLFTSLEVQALMAEASPRGDLLLKSTS